MTKYDPNDLLMRTSRVHPFTCGRCGCELNTELCPACQDLGDMPEKTFLFEYSHLGRNWQLEIKAADMEDAKQRISKLTYARPVGELIAKVPAEAGWFAKIACWVRNVVK